MKKAIFITLLSSLLLTNCSSTTVNNKNISWNVAGRLPAQKGYNKNIGTAGVLYGAIGNYFIAGGGANFPIKPVLEGGAKVIYSDVYLMREKDGKLEIVEQSNFPHKIGYGASVSVKDGIYYIGGGENSEKDKEIWFLSLEKNSLKYEKIGELPFAFQSGGAVFKDGKLYIFAGKQDGKASKKFWEYNLKTKEVKELSDVPGDTRTQCIGQILDGKLYVFGGGNSKAFIDGYKYDFENNSWENVADIRISGKEISVLGGNSVKINENEMLVIGGFNKELWNDANHYLSTLKDEELAKYKFNYFTQDPIDFNWNSEILLYNAKENSWKSLGEIPFDAPCGEGLVIIGNKIYSINGEIKPGVRTNRVYRGIFN